MIRTTHPFRSSLPHSRRGFTLVEMMVAVALVVVMMLMFATVFQT
ncbi:MAG: prepilin-type N-terminal cleavage/methylation domain-containing protein, partial [Planctomycetaceae bacterium]|nr:prepilin-type N-terminal cleavage/methylation domain-containing protein [Planctomycetaceae bacterium]